MEAVRGDLCRDGRRSVGEYEVPRVESPDMKECERDVILQILEERSALAENDWADHPA
jgi:hypothetical protein